MSPLSKEWVFHVLKCCQQGVYYRIVCSCQFLYFLRQCILNYASLMISTVAIFINSRWRPDTLQVVISTKFNMKLYITKYMDAKFRAFVINIF